jgi:hypothetical protein
LFKKEGGIKTNIDGDLLVKDYLYLNYYSGRGVFRKT